MVEIRPGEVTAVLKQQIASAGARTEWKSVGRVLQVGDGVARVHGLDDCMMSELLKFPHGVMGVALSLEEDNVGGVLFGSDRLVKEGDLVESTGRILSVPTGEALLGRVVNALGAPIDGKGPLKVADSDYRPVEGRAPSVIERQPVKEALQTGIKAIDAMIPIGRGQRELIIGDRQTGKTAIVLDTFINQRSTGGGDPANPAQVLCIYVATGQKQSTVVDVVRKLEEHGAMPYTIVVSATAGEPASMQFLSPYGACAMGERLRDEGRHVVIAYDDLYKQATAYRQVMLLLRRPPGREAFPGDIFNLHSRLLERAAKLADDAPKKNPVFKKGGGSLTALPIVETQEGDYAAYIPTNVISITDGQIYLEADLFNAGVRPGINVGISVSRVGGNAQIPAMRKTAGGLRIGLAQYRDLKAFAQFGSDLDKATLAQITRGQRLEELLKQGQFAPLPVEEQVVAIYAGTKGFLDDLPVEKVRPFEEALRRFLRDRHPEIGKSVRETRKLDEATEKALVAAIPVAKAEFAAGRLG
ncbi:MAG TPA: F0F1 ATP synthase subunit alpha [Planctomycetota bacterium]|jgi:F-type H+-transporting ATPase subunit alpha|nr:F0F1 ATP synthase subunit alpha [Planctomycetota bacterium]